MTFTIKIEVFLKLVIPFNSAAGYIETCIIIFQYIFSNAANITLKIFVPVQLFNIAHKFIPIFSVRDFMEQIFNILRLKFIFISCKKFTSVCSHLVTPGNFKHDRLHTFVPQHKIIQKGRQKMQKYLIEKVRKSTGSICEIRIHHYIFARINA